MADRAEEAWTIRAQGLCCLTAFNSGMRPNGLAAPDSAPVAASTSGLLSMLSGHSGPLDPRQSDNKRFFFKQIRDAKKK